MHAEAFEEQKWFAGTVDGDVDMFQENPVSEYRIELVVDSEVVAASQDILLPHGYRYSYSYNENPYDEDWTENELVVNPSDLFDPSWDVDFMLHESKLQERNEDNATVYIEDVPYDVEEKQLLVEARADWNVEREVEYDAVFRVFPGPRENSRSHRPLLQFTGGEEITF